MFRWLSRYVKKIEVFGVGIELREIPPEEALPLLAPKPTQPPPPQSPAPTQPTDPIVQRQDFIRVFGTSPSSRRTPRELDLMIDADDLQVHIHQPDGNQTPVWLDRKALQNALDVWKGPTSGEPITVPGRTRRKETPVVFVVDQEDEIEIQAASWWIWVPRADLKAALQELGIRAPWK